MNNSYTFTKDEIYKINQIKKSIYMLAAIKGDKKQNIVILIPRNEISNEEKKEILMMKK